MHFQTKLNESILRNKENDISAAELIPIVFLGILSVVGCFLNVLACFAYLRKAKALQNPGNLFTVSLVVGDLLFSLFAIPLVIIAETLDAKQVIIGKQGLFLGTRCILFFCCNISAIGNTMLTFDRFDLTQRPSNRFLKRKKAIVLILLAWTSAVLFLLSPLLSSSLVSKKTFHRKLITQNHNGSWESWSLSNATGNNTFASNTSAKNQRVVCSATCHHAHLSFVYARSNSQVCIQCGYYIFAALTMFAIYGKIIFSLHKRTFKYETLEPSGSVSRSKYKFTSFLNQTFCCVRRQDEDDAQNVQLYSSGATPKSETTVILSQDGHANTALNQSHKTTHFGRYEEEEQLQLTQANIGAYDATNSFNKTDFASVAFSVKAFMILKKAVRERRKMKQKKLQQLRKMSVAIVGAYVFSWFPFHIFSLLTLSKTSQRFTTFCLLQDCLNVSTSFNGETVLINVDAGSKEKMFRVAFLWCLVLVSVTPITNAILYTFSRENLQKEIKKTYRQVTKSNDIDLPPIKRDRTTSLRLKTTDFRSLKVFNKSKRSKSQNNVSPNSLFWERNHLNFGKQVPKIVPLKDPDALTPTSKRYDVSKENSFCSVLSSNKSTVETSFASTKSESNNSLDG